jgi:hypothetical protein
MKTKKLFTWANLLLIIAILIHPTYYIAWQYPLERDVWGVLDRAQISAESDDMLRLVNIAINNIENKRSLFSGYPQTEGYCALIFQKPENSLEMQYTAMSNIRKRLQRTDTFDKNSVEYQVAIDDIRGTIRELPYIDCWIWHFK